MEQHICPCGRGIVQPVSGRRKYCGSCPCPVAGCSRPVKLKGFCSYHYELDRRVRAGKVCNTERCSKPVNAKGLCTACYKRAYLATEEHRQRRRQYNRAYNRTYKRKARAVQCAHCGDYSIKRQSRGRFCSVQCAQAWRSVRREVGSDLDPNEWHEAECEVCAKHFMIAVWNCTTCSDECADMLTAATHARNRYRRRVREAAAYVEDVNPKIVFGRDGFRCHLCGQLTGRDLKYPHPRSPSIDHVIPLSKGGTHEMANVRTACLRCNIKKGNRGGGEQLAPQF